MNKLKLLPIPACYQYPTICRYCDDTAEVIAFCTHPSLKRKRKIKNVYRFPSWCPLPDAPERMHIERESK